MADPLLQLYGNQQVVGIFGSSNSQGARIDIFDNQNSNSGYQLLVQNSNFSVRAGSGLPQATRVGIASTSPAATLDILGNSNIPALRSVQIGTGPSLQAFASSNAGTVPTLVVQSSNVGINTSTPSTADALDIVGTVRASAGLRIGACNVLDSNVNLVATSATLTQSNASLPALRVNQRGAGNVAEFLDADLPVMTLNPAGYLGVGTSNPQYHVDTVGYVRSSLGFRVGDQEVIDADGNIITRNIEVLDGTGQTALYVANDGAVGVGTDIPVSKLHVEGGVYVTGSTSGVNLGGTDANNLTNTYFTFGTAGSANDYAYLRQVGGDNALTMALDLHDDGAEGFQIRTINSWEGVDRMQIPLSVSNSNVSIGSGSMETIVANTPEALRFLPANVIIYNTGTTVVSSGTYYDGTYISNGSGQREGAYNMRRIFQASTVPWRTVAAWSSTDGSYIGSSFVVMNGTSNFGEYSWINMSVPLLVSSAFLRVVLGAQPKDIQIWGTSNDINFELLASLTTTPGQADYTIYFNTKNYYTKFYYIVKTTWNTIYGDTTQLYFFGTRDEKRTLVYGNLGIGTSPTGAKLDVLQTSNLTAVEVNNTGTGRILDLQSNGATQMVVTSGGIVGMGTSNPAARLDVVYNSSNTALQVNQQGTGRIVDFQENGTSMMVINDVGNVGIGVSLPQVPLDTYATTTDETFRFPPVGLTSDTYTVTGSLYANGTYVSSASSVINATFVAWEAFDDGTVSSNHWASGGSTYNSTTGVYSSVVPKSTAGYSGEWLQLNFPESMTLKSYTLVSRNNGNRGDPKDFAVFGSTDGTNWTQLHSVTGATFSGAGASNTYTVSNATAYTYYRIAFNSITIVGSGVSWVSVRSWRIFGIPQRGVATLQVAPQKVVVPYGNVGIGTTAPSEKLHVLGNIFIGSNSNLDDDSNYSIYSTGQLLITADAQSSANTLYSGLILSAGASNSSRPNFVEMKTQGKNAVFIGSNQFVGIQPNQTVYTSGATPPQALSVLGNTYVRDSVGIGTATPKYSLDTQGIVRLGNQIFATFERTLGTTANNTTMICHMNSFAGGYAIRLVVAHSEGSSSISKVYDFAHAYGETASTWRELLPISSSGPYAPQDFTVDIASVPNNISSQCQLRLRRVAGTAATLGFTCSLIIVESQRNQVTITDVSTTGTGGSVSGLYNATQITQVDGSVGVGISAPVAKLNVYQLAGNEALRVEQASLEYPPLALTSNVTNITNAQYGNGTYIASTSSLTATYEPFEAFNKTTPDASDAWIGGIYNSNTGAYLGTTSNGSYAGDWIQIALPSCITVNSYQITNRNHSTRGDPKDFALFGSLDGSNWIQLHSVTNAIFGGPGVTNTYTIPGSNNAAYLYYRLAVQSITPVGVNITYVSIGELRLFGNAGPSLRVQADTISTPTYTNFGVGTPFPQGILDIHAATGDSNFEFPPVAMSGTSHFVTGSLYGNGLYTATASTIWSDNFPAWYAFDKIAPLDTNAWISAPNSYSNSAGTYLRSATTGSYLGEWLELAAPAPFILKSYSITSRNGTSFRGDPKDFAVFGSVDDINWVQLHTVTGATFGNSVTNTYQVSNTTPYSYYRLAVQSVTIFGANYVTISEWRLFGVPTSVSTLQVQPQKLLITGNTGIGTTNPTDPLHVQGNMLVTGSMKASAIPYQSATAWYKLGTFTHNSTGNTCLITVSGGYGFDQIVNNPTNANALTYIYLRAGNAVNLNLTGNFWSHGRVRVTGAINQVKVTTSGASSNATTWDVYALCAAFIGNAFVSAVTDRNSTFTVNPTAYTANSTWVSTGGYELDLISEWSVVTTGSNLGLFQNALGNVGVGTTNPSYKLNVFDGTKVTLTAGNDKQITQFPPFALTSDTMVVTNASRSIWNGTYTVTTSVPASSPAWQAFDRSMSTYWQLEATTTQFSTTFPFNGWGWIQIQFPYSIVPTSIELQNPGAGYYGVPDITTIDASTDGSNYVNLGTINASTYNATRSLAVSTTQAYSYYRLGVSSLSSADPLRIHEIRIFGYIANDTRVGIGTTLPQATFDVSGDIFSSGQVGIGTTLPGAKVDILHSNTTPALEVNQQGTGRILELQDNGTAVVVVNDGGNVGIGTSQPLSSLHVIGYDDVERVFPPLPFNNSTTTGSASSTTTLTVSSNLYGNGVYVVADGCVSGYNIYNFGAWAAFDGSLSTFFRSCGGFTNANSTAFYGTVFVRFVLPTPVRLSRYTIYAPANNVNNPKSWTLEGSSDESTYVAVNTQSSILWDVTETKSFTVTTTAAYRFYRFVFTQTQGAAEMSLYDVKLYGYIQNVLIDSRTSEVQYTQSLITSGRVGIGSTNPQTNLDVVGNIAASGLITASNLSGNLQFETYTSATAYSSISATSNFIMDTTSTSYDPYLHFGSNDNRIGYVYNIVINDEDASTQWVEYAVPAGMKQAYLAHLAWNNCRYFDVEGRRSDGVYRFIVRVNAYSSRTSNTGNEFDGVQIVPIPAVDRFTHIRIQGRKGRYHIMGFAWTKEDRRFGHPHSFVHTDNIIGAISVSGSNVGIGTTPAFRLHVQGGDIQVTNSATPTINWGTSTNTNRGQLGYITTAGTIVTGSAVGDIVLRNDDQTKKVHILAGAGITPTVTVTSNFVGLGTTTPENRLHVIGNATIGGGIKSLGSSGTGGIYIEGGTTWDNQGANAGWNVINFNGYYSNGEVTVNTNKTRWRVGVDQRSTSDYFFINTTGAGGTVITIPASGNVGIGTATPAYKLQVAGTLSATTYDNLPQKVWNAATMGVVGGSSNLYFKIATLSANNNAGNFSQLTINGSLGSVTSVEVASIQARMGNRNAGLTVSGISHGYPQTVKSLVDIVVYTEADSTLSVYIHAKSSFKMFDLVVGGNGQGVTLIEPNNVTVTPTGTLTLSSLIDSLTMTLDKGNMGIGTMAPTASLHVINSFNATSNDAFRVEQTQVEYPPVALTANVTNINNAAYGNGVYVTSASTVFTSEYQAFEAFNKTLNPVNLDGWISLANSYSSNTGAYLLTTTTNSYLGEWLQMQFPYPVAVFGYSISVRNQTVRGDPKDFALFGSIDGANWIQLHTVTGATFTIAGSNTYSIANSSNALFSYYRIAVNSVTATTTQASYASIAELRFFGSSGTSVRITPENWVTSPSMNVGIGTTLPQTLLDIYATRTDTPVEYPPSPMSGASTFITGQTYGNGLYIASSSTAFAAAYSAWDAFDKSTSAAINAWVSGGNTYNSNTGAYALSTSTAGYLGEWLQLQLPSPMMIKSCSLTARNDVNRGSPKDFVILGSLDATNWTLLFATSNQTFGQTTTNTYSMPNNFTHYTYYRLVIQNVTLTSAVVNWASVGEWRLYGIPQSASVVQVRSDTAKLAVYGNAQINNVWFSDLNKRAKESYGTALNTINATWRSQRNAADNGWLSVCWASELRIFCAVANTGSGNRVMTSSDGIQWVSRTNPVNNNWVSVCWAPEISLFCAVAESGGTNSVMTSPDGITWTTQTTPNNNWRSVCWAPELRLFCAVANSGTGNRVMTSPDGITWTARTSAADNQWISVCWSSELRLFCAVADSGTDNRVMTSPDGITWTTRFIPVNNNWANVCWSPELGLFCAVAYSGTGNRVMTSPDGITWTTQASAADSGWFSVCWSPELSVFCAVAFSGNAGQRLMTSPDGITWSLRTYENENNWNCVCWAPELSRFCAVASTGTSTRVMISAIAAPAPLSTLLVSPAHMTAVQTSGFIGIGTKTPQAQLHIEQGSNTPVDTLLVRYTNTYEYPPVAFTADTQTVTTGFYGRGSYAVLASSTYDTSTYLAWKALNKTNINNSDCWIGINAGYNGTTGVYQNTANYPRSTETSGSTNYPGDWIQINLPTPMILNSYSITARLNSQRGDPKHFNLYAQTAGSNWTLLHGVSNATFSSGSINTYTVTNSNAYITYRLAVNAITPISSATFVSIGEWRLFGVLDISVDVDANGLVLGSQSRMGVGTVMPYNTLDVSGGILARNGVIQSQNFQYATKNLASGLVRRRFITNTSNGDHPLSEDDFTLKLQSWALSNVDTVSNIQGLGSFADLYGYEFAGYLFTSNAGIYTFGVNADDAIDLFVDGQLVAYWYAGHGYNITGLPGGTTTAVYLTVGYHRIVCRYEEGGGGDGCEALWKKPGDTTWSVIPAANFFYEANDLLQVSGGNVGIGITNPVYPLHVNGNIASTTGFRVLNPDPNVLIEKYYDVNGNRYGLAQTTGGTVRLYAAGNVANATVNISKATDDSAYTDMVTVKNDGNVGIGTTNPSSRFVVYNGDYTTNSYPTGGVAVIDYRNAGGMGGSLVLRNSSGATTIGSSACLAFELDGSTAFTNTGGDATSAAIIASMEAANNATGLRFHTWNGTANAERVRITNDGNVGIGTANPLSKLHVQGGIRLEGETAPVVAGTIDAGNLTNTYITFGANAANNDWAYLRQIGTDNNFIMALDLHDDGNSESFQIRNVKSTDNPDTVSIAFAASNGSVGIGTAAPSQKLHVVGRIYATDIIDSDNQFYGPTSDTAGKPTYSWDGDSNTGIFHPASDVIGFSTNATERMRIDASGNVGIGTSPTARLHVHYAQGTNNPASGGIYMYNPTNSANQHASCAVRVAGASAGNPYYSLDVNSVGGWSLGIDNATAGDPLLIRRSWDFSASSVFQLTSNGNLTITGDITAFGSLSDQRLKKDISILESSLDALRKLQPVDFTWKENVFNPEKANTQDVGFIAQDVYSILPKLVKTIKLPDVAEDYLGISYEKLTPYLVKAVQELDQSFSSTSESLKAELTATKELLTAENEALKAELAATKDQLAALTSELAAIKELLSK